MIAQTSFKSNASYFRGSFPNEIYVRTLLDSVIAIERNVLLTDKSLMWNGNLVTIVITGNKIMMEIDQFLYYV